MDRRVTLAFARFDAAELKLCRYLNRSSRSSAVRQVFRGVSWLGDGWLWYAVISMLPLLDGTAGFYTSLHLTLTARPRHRLVQADQEPRSSRAAVHHA